MTELTNDKAFGMVQSNLEFLDDVIKHAVVNLLDDKGITKADKEFVRELQYIYDSYVATEKYGG